MGKKNNDIATKIMNDMIMNSDKSSKITPFQINLESEMLDDEDGFYEDEEYERCDGVGRTSEGFYESFYFLGEQSILDSLWNTDREKERMIKKLQDWCDERLMKLHNIKPGSIIVSDFNGELDEEVYGLVVDFGRFCHGCGGRKDDHGVSVTYETMHEFKVSFINQDGTVISMWLDELVEADARVIDHIDEIGDSIFNWKQRWK